MPDTNIKDIFISTPKALIPTLPRYAYDGRIEVVQSGREAMAAVQALRRYPMLGIDTETRPVFHKGGHHQVALLQVACTDLCFLFRLNMTDFLPCLVELMEDASLPKVGLSLRDDRAALYDRHPFTPGGWIDLQDIAAQMGIEDMSLQKLYANFFGMRISKSARLSNWEADVLSESQKVYAATDAYACLTLYDEFCRLNETKAYRLVE